MFHAGVEADLVHTRARCTHRVAISNHRITAVADGHVSFTYRDRQHGGVIRDLTLPAESFIDRFLLHVVPPHVPRIQHVRSRPSPGARPSQHPIVAPMRRGTAASKPHSLARAPSTSRGFVQSVLSAMLRTADKTLFIRGVSARLPLAD